MIVQEIKANSKAVFVALANQSTSYDCCVSELIDNALDKEGKNIQLTHKEKSLFRIEDDGIGVESLKLLPELGGHTDSGKNGSGKYGMGFPHAVLCIGGEKSTVRVVTVKDGWLKRCDIDWWKDIGSYVEKDPIRAKLPNGTVVSIFNPNTNFTHSDSQKKLAHLLAYRYSTAIEKGVRIALQFKRQFFELSKTSNLRWVPPPLEEDCISKTIEERGKKFTITAGNVIEGVKNEHPGITYIFGNRSIEEGSVKGLPAPYNPRLYCSVVLDEGFRDNRSTNKDKLKDCAWIRKAVAEVVRPLQEKAQKRSESIGLEIDGLALGKLLGPLVTGYRRSGGGGGNPVDPPNPPPPDPPNPPPPDPPNPPPPDPPKPKPVDTDSNKKESPEPSADINYMTGWQRGIDDYGRCAIPDGGRPNISLYRDHPAVEKALCSPERKMYLLLLAAPTVLAAMGVKTEEFLPLLTKAYAKLPDELDQKRPVDVDE